KVNNYGVGGTRIAYQRHPSEKARYDLDFCGRCYDMDPNADIIVVFGGVNDYGHGDAPFGTVGDTSRSTFCGSVDYLCRTIRELYPDAVPVFLAPAHCLGDRCPSEGGIKPQDAEMRPLVDYVQAILEIAPRHGFHTLSLYDELGLDPNDNAVYEEYTVDGLHFNDKGHFLIAGCIQRFLESL
ncbi:MAG: SGNH/GDSL hydrolase family protein, partial [Spirochaetales bacterium]|nr:SGNH/GDSL hydrolase family protein [Candidatus Physcosoma equi]